MRRSGQPIKEEDPLVSYQWSVDTRDKIASFGINAKLTSFPGNVHVPFDRYGDLIEKQSAKLPYRSLDLADAQR